MEAMTNLADLSLSLATLTLGLASDSWLLRGLIIVFILISVMLVLVILIQKPQGGGLSGAFGASSGSGQTVFGAKTGDALTWMTVTVFVLYLGITITMNYAARPPKAGEEAPAAETPATTPATTPPATTPPATTPPATTPAAATPATAPVTPAATDGGMPQAPGGMPTSIELPKAPVNPIALPPATTPPATTPPSTTPPASTPPAPAPPASTPPASTPPASTPPASNP